MRDIYLIDFENVASEGLSGITYLSEEDQVIIFYSNNSNRLTMKMHILIGKSICNLTYFEVSVGGKNALDHQISTYLGYLMGTEAAQRNYYIVSRDMGYKHVANFWAAQRIGPKVRCIDSIKGASRLERNRKEPVLQAIPGESPSEASVPEIREAVLQSPPVQEASAPELLLPETLVQEPVTEPTSKLPPELSAEPAPLEAAASPMADSQKSPEVQEASTQEGEPAEETMTPPSETSSQEPKEEKQEPQHRVNRNRPRPRSRYRSRNYSADGDTRAPREPQETPSVAEASPPDAPAKETEPVENKQEPQDKSPASAEKKPEPKRRSVSQKPKASKQEPGNLDQLPALIAPYPKLQESVLRELIANNKRQVLCNTLRKHLGQEKGLALYNEIKKSAWH